MKQPELEFGDRVVPSYTAYENGVFDWNDRGTIVGLVVWAGEDMDEPKVIVHRRGQKTSTRYASRFWVKEVK